MVRYSPAAQSEIGVVMQEFGQGNLHSGSKKVTSQKQAVAIAISEAKKNGFKVPKSK